MLLKVWDGFARRKAGIRIFRCVEEGVILGRATDGAKAQIPLEQEMMSENEVMNDYIAAGTDILSRTDIVSAHHIEAEIMDRFVLELGNE